MRVTGGIYRGRRLVMPPGTTRPTTDRLRESVFAALGSAGLQLAGAEMLDLFSGSGIVAVEAASRGAAGVTLVERDPRKRVTLLRNTEFVGVPVQVRIMPAERFVARAARQWRLIFVDPPYAYRHTEELLSRIAARQLLGDDGVLVVHSATPYPFDEAATDLWCFDRRRYGGATARFFRAGAAGAAGAAGTTARLS